MATFSLARTRSIEPIVAGPILPVSLGSSASRHRNSSHEAVSRVNSSLKKVCSRNAPIETGGHWLTRCVGDFDAGIPLPPPRSLDELETNLEGKDKERFLQLMKKMLVWVPENRSTAKTPGLRTSFDALGIPLRCMQRESCQHHQNSWVGSCHWREKNQT